MTLGTHHHVGVFIHAVGDARSDGARDLERLVEAAAGGHEAAWRAIVARFVHRLGRIAQTYRLPANDVDDIVQATFVRLYENLGTLRDPRALSPWLETTARREALKRLRAGARECPLPEDIERRLQAVATVDEYADEDLAIKLRRAIDRLPRRQRELMRLFDSPDDLSYEEISHRLAMPVGSIGPTRARALANLRDDQELLAACAGR
jgi:RNA polymerase sigma factor (sigma-70 family)